MKGPSNKSYTTHSWPQAKRRAKTTPYRGMTVLIVTKDKNKRRDKMNLANYLNSLKVMIKK